MTLVVAVQQSRPVTNAISGLFLAMTLHHPSHAPSVYVGLSIPVIGAGVALDRGASPPDTVLGFAIVVGLGVAGAGALLGRALNNEHRPA